MTGLNELMRPVFVKGGKNSFVMRTYLEVVRMLLEADRMLLVVVVDHMQVVVLNDEMGLKE